MSPRLKGSTGYRRSSQFRDKKRISYYFASLLPTRCMTHFIKQASFVPSNLLLFFFSLANIVYIAEIIRATKKKSIDEIILIRDLLIILDKR